MPIKFKAGFKPSVILSKIAGSTNVTGGGAVAFSGFEIFELAPVLHSMLSFPDVAKDADAKSLVWKALSAQDAMQSEQAFLRAINDELSRQLSKKIEEFELLTSVSFVPGTTWPKVMRVNGCSIRVYGSTFPRKFSSRTALIETHSKSGIVTKPLGNYIAVGVRVKGRSPDRAASKALKELDLLRGILCLQANKTMQVTFAGSEFNPINVIRLGSCHTLHGIDGKAAMEGIWYDPSYRSTQPFSFKDSSVALKNTKFALRRLAGSKFGTRVFEAVVRYSRALDEPDPGTAFLKLWSAVESLTTPEVAKYDDLIYRCAFLFEDHEYHTQLLQHLREYRNRSVHPGEGVEQTRIHCFQLQSYFHTLFWFLVRNAKDFASLAEVHEFLSLPIDTKIILRRRQLLNKAIKFRAPH